MGNIVGEGGGHPPNRVRASLLSPKHILKCSKAILCTLEALQKVFETRPLRTGLYANRGKNVLLLSLCSPCFSESLRGDLHRRNRLVLTQEWPNSAHNTSATPLAPAGSCLMPVLPRNAHRKKSYFCLLAGAGLSKKWWFLMIFGDFFDDFSWFFMNILFFRGSRISPSPPCRFAAWPPQAYGMNVVERMVCSKKSSRKKNF